MLVLSSTAASRQYNCCIHGRTSPGNYGHDLVFYVPNKCFDSDVIRLSRNVRCTEPQDYVSLTKERGTESPVYSTFSIPSNKLLLLAGFSSTLALERSSRNCVHNTLFIDECYQELDIHHHFGELVL
jgi:hypothetical protein